VSRAIRRATSPAAEAEAGKWHPGVGVQTNALDVHVVASLAGGTGGGMFLDAAYLVRHLVSLHGPTATHLMGTLLVPDIHEEAPYVHLQCANAYAALQELAQPQTFAGKYDLDPATAVLLFAMGDGNHSLATAKAIWEKIKGQVGPDHPARYAIVEIENVHDEGLDFEPIHRVLFDVKSDVVAAMDQFYAGGCRLAPCRSANEMVKLVDGQKGRAQAFGVITPQGLNVATVAEPVTNLPVGTLQRFLDAWGKQGGFAKIDYVHGQDVTVRLGAQAGNVGFYLPAMPKSALFKTVILDGALPRKTFSMGEAKDKRFYMEARRIA